MNNFERMGEAQLLAYEGQRQIARAIGHALAGLLPLFGKVLNRCLPQGNMAPW